MPMKAHHCTAGAARSGYLDVLKWLCSQGCTLDGTEYYEAACGHHLHVLRWLQAQRAPIPTTDRSSGYRELRAPIFIFRGDLGIPLLVSGEGAPHGPVDVLHLPWAAAHGAAAQSRTPAGVSSRLLVLLHHVPQARTSWWGCSGCPRSLPTASQSWQVCSMISLADSGLSQDRCLGTAQASNT